MPISPADAEKLAARVQALYLGAQMDLITQINRRLAKGIEDPHWTELKLREITQLRRAVNTTLERLEKGSDAALRDIMAGSYKIGAVTAEQDWRKVFPKDDPRPIGHHVSTFAVNAFTQAAIDKMAPTFLRVRRWADDVYKNTIELASFPMTVGVLTRRQATAKALGHFAKLGVTGFTDRSGRHWNLDSYAEMATRTVAGQAAIQGHMDQTTAHDHHLVMVSDAPEECPVCRRYEGKILSLPPVWAGTYADMAGSNYIVTATLDSAIADGLFHPNCRHRTTAFFPGISEQLHDTADPEGDELRQTQRAYERRIRELKRQLLAQEGIDPLAADRTAQKLKAKQAEFKAWREEHDRKNLAYRTTVRGPTPTTRRRRPAPAPAPATELGPTGAKPTPEGNLDIQLERIRKAGSIKEVDAALNDYLGSRGTANLSKARMIRTMRPDMDQVRSVAEQFVKLMDEHPDVKCNIETRPMREYAHAEASRTPYAGPGGIQAYRYHSYTLRFDPEKLFNENTRAQHAGQAIDEADSRWNLWRTGTFESGFVNGFNHAQYITTHEFGHILDYEQGNRHEGTRFYAYVPKLLEDLYADEGVPRPSAEAYKLKRELFSEYQREGGKGTGSEWVSEAWAEVYLYGSEANRGNLRLVRKLWQLLGLNPVMELNKIDARIAATPPPRRLG